MSQAAPNTEYHRHPSCQSVTYSRYKATQKDVRSEGLSQAGPNTKYIIGTPIAPTREAAGIVGLESVRGKQGVGPTLARDHIVNQCATAHGSREYHRGPSCRSAWQPVQSRTYICRYKAEQGACKASKGSQAAPARVATLAANAPQRMVAREDSIGSHRARRMAAGRK